MSGDLPKADRVDVESHLATCADCRSYRDELGSMTALLTVSRELCSDVELRETARMRWARDFEAALEPDHSIVARVLFTFLDWTRDMIWPCRRMWAGLAAIWIAILGLNASQRAEQEARASHAPSPEIMRALLAREGFLTGPSRGAEHDVEAPRQSAPRPRSEQLQESKPSGA
jgi:hypothetical protein